MALFKIVDILPEEKKKGYVYLQRADEKNAIMYADISDTERINVAANAIVQGDNTIDAECLATIADIEELREQLNEILIQVSMGAKIFPMTLDVDKWIEDSVGYSYEADISAQNPDSVIVQCTRGTEDYAYMSACKVTSNKIFFYSSILPKNSIELLIIIK